MKDVLTIVGQERRGGYLRNTDLARAVDLAYLDGTFATAPGTPMSVRIYKPAKTAMQSGIAQTDAWVLEHVSEVRREIDPLMGWTGSTDTQGQVKLNFATKAEAIAYAERMGLAYSISEPAPRAHIRKSYADNFKFGRVGSWTH